MAKFIELKNHISISLDDNTCILTRVEHFIQTASNIICLNRNSIIPVFFILAITISKVQGQSEIIKPSFLAIDTDSKTKENLLNAIDTLFKGIDNENLDSTLIGRDNPKLTISILKSLKGMEDNEKDSIKNFYKRQIINLYPISTTSYFISIAYIGNKSGESAVLKTIFNLIAKKEDGKLVFSIPTRYLTKAWKTKQIGNTKYYFADNINIKRAKIFNEKNSTIARKFGLKPEKFEFYLCDNYQDVIQLLGYEYDMESNGKTRSCYGVDANTIFSVNHNEDFSHDLFHYYSAKIRGNTRNWYAEEGFAYCWGDAYWTKPNGETITQDELVKELQIYVSSNPNISLFELFEKNPNILKYSSNEISLNKILASLICKEVERKHGIEGVKELLKCGSGLDNFFKTTDKLVGINKTNFDIEVMKLLKAYK